jgi:hypothetical protein
MVVEVHWQPASSKSRPMDRSSTIAAHTRNTSSVRVWRLDIRLPIICHSRVGGNPEVYRFGARAPHSLICSPSGWRLTHWIPACAGMTVRINRRLPS